MDQDSVQEESISVYLLSLQLSVVKHGDFQAVSMDVKIWHFSREELQNSPQESRAR